MEPPNTNTATPTTQHAQHVQFDNTPQRAPKLTPLSPRRPHTTSIFTEMLSAEKPKSMADLDKEYEVRLAESHHDKTKDSGHGFQFWVDKLTRMVGKK